MGSSSKRRQTFSKMTREQAVREKRANKQEKKNEKKLAAAEGAEPVPAEAYDDSDNLNAPSRYRTAEGGPNRA